MAYVPSIAFRESPLGPWGSLKSSSAQHGNVALDATPPAQKRPTEAIGSISSINTFLNKGGFPRKSTLPPLIIDFSKPLTGKVDYLSEEMASRKGIKYPKRTPQSKGEQSKDMGTDPGEKLEGKCADTQLIEMAAFPGYSPDKPTPLPHNIDTLEQMKRIIRAHRKLSTKARKFQEAWCKLFYCRYSQEIFLDYYWWFFLHRYQTGHHVTIQDSLFTRISENYVKLLCQPIEMKWRDTHFKMYPDAIAQCVYSTFICAYPNSWNNFDEDFKNELILCITLWQVGTRPLPGLWTKWNLSFLEPRNMLKNVGKETDSDKTLPHESPNVETAKQRDDAGEGDKDKAINSGFRRLSLEEVRQTLHGSNESLVPLVRHSYREQPEEGKIMPSASEEKRIGLAREQFHALERHSVKEFVKVFPRRTSQCISDTTLPSLSDKCHHIGDGSKKSGAVPQLITPIGEFAQTELGNGSESTIQYACKESLKLKYSSNMPNTQPSFELPTTKSSKVGSTTKKIIEPSARRTGNQPVQPPPMLGSGTSKLATTSSPRTVRKPIQPTKTSKQSPRSSNRSSPRSSARNSSKRAAQTRVQSATKKGVQSSPGNATSKSTQPTSKAGHPNLSQLNSVSTQGVNTVKSKQQQQASNRVHAQPSKDLSPADELINRAKAKIGGFSSTQQHAAATGQQSRTQPPKKVVASMAASQTKVTSKDPNQPGLANDKRPILQAKKRLPATSSHATQIKNTAGQTDSSLASIKDADAALQTKTQQVKISNVAQSSCRARVNGSQDHGTKHASPANPKVVYQQACAELKEMANAFKERTTEEILSSIKGPEFEHVLFNFHGHSPLVKHYITNNRRTHINEKESIVGRTEIVEEQPEKAACYKDILAQSKRMSEQNHAMFQRYYELQKQVLNASMKKRLDDKHKHEANVKMVLANKKEVQQLSNELTLCAAQRKDLDQSERTKAVQKVLDRVINH